MESQPGPATLLLAYDFPPRTGGIARCLSEIARHYPSGAMVVSTGSDPSAASVDEGSPNRIERVGVPLERLRSLGGLRRWSRQARALAEEGAIGFTWAGNLKPAGYVAYSLHRRSKIPWGAITYGLDLLLLEQQLNRSPVKRAVARRLLGDAAVVVAISRWTRDRLLALRERLGLPDYPGASRIVPLGADPLRFRPALDTRDVRARYGLGDGRWLLTVARLMEHKGIDTGLQLLATVREECSDLGYAIAGSGPMLGELQTQAERLGLGRRVRFLGQVPDTDLPALYNAAAIYLGLSREISGQVEGFGLSLLEASACGVPVVAGRSGGVPDAVRDGDTGVLVDPSSPLAAVTAVRALLLDTSVARRLGSSGRSAVVAYFNWNRVVTDLQAIEAEVRNPVVRGGR